MSAALHLAKPADLDRLTALVAAFHAEVGIEQSDEARRAGLAPLLEGIPHGAAYLLGPARAPMGYIIVTFGWSVEFGGMDGFIDELYLRPAIRKRGIASEALISLPKALAQAGVKALHLEVNRTNGSAQKLYARAGFRAREDYMLMSRRL
ncbi:GNAT family N-acetyltransferase [Sedimentitalea nanhaiensis]|uniref:Acetyltransferase (GNAT) family protein n=1 Tax=Sedimentitalea nanhaiensis TaxID=999627 RepID=A0A1I7ANI8_9RHOB|nr:GNAT family N-acetyltransferase [Sedimentitalea nanhaiensis]SFT76435.1 Acetyltransferase (GNAT) family protein [Sedimentitalea nanhaiensis]